MDSPSSAQRLGAATAAIWLLCGAAFGLVVWFGLLRGDIVRLLVPETIDPRHWTSPMPWPIVVPAASTVLAGALASALGNIILRRSATSARAVVVLALWLVVVATFAVVGTLSGISLLIGRGAPASLSTVAQGLPADLAPALYAGLITGWIAALLATIGRPRVGGRAVPPPIPSPVSADGRGSTRPGRRLDAAIMVVAAASAVALVAAGAAESAQASASGLAGHAPPSMQQPAPTPVPTGTPPPARAPGDHPADPNWCTVSQLAFADLGGDAATGHREESVQVTNTGRDHCVLPGYPDVAFADAHGVDVPAAVRNGSGFMTQDPGSAALTLAPGDRAVAWLAWDATDGRTVIPQLYLAPYAGADRQLLITRGMDITAQTEVAVTAWSRPTAGP
jgi:uncharacterized protein DUF4232